ncbi:hypothetical protein CV019_00770, partial [Staphylococcus haemolyticus]
ADRHILAREVEEFGNGADRLADLQLGIPQGVERRFDDLLAPGRARGGGEEHEVDVAERRHLAAAVAAERDQADSLGRRRVGVAVGGARVGEGAADQGGGEGRNEGGMIAPAGRVGGHPLGKVGAVGRELLAEGQRFSHPARAISAGRARRAPRAVSA